MKSFTRSSPSPAVCRRLALAAVVVALFHPASPGALPGAQAGTLPGPASQRNLAVKSGQGPTDSPAPQLSVVLPPPRPVNVAYLAPTLFAAAAPADAEQPVPSAATANPPARDSVATHAGDKTLYSFHAENLELKMALAMFARANNLNIVPDNDVTGMVTLDVRDLPLHQMMRALLEANDYSWQEEQGLIRIRAAESRTFTLDYLRLSRKSTGQSVAMLSASTSGGGGMGGGGMGGGGMGGGGMGGGTGGAGGGMGGGGGGGASSISLSGDNSIDFWKELAEELGLLVTDKGKNSLAINKTAGLVYLTDRPSALKRVERFLNSIGETVQRQVEIEAKIYAVELNRTFQFGIDWAHLAQAYAGTLTYGASTLPQGIGSLEPGTPSAVKMTFKNSNTQADVNALQTQGNVEVISKPRIRTLNNQTALIKVGTDKPFFSQTSTLLQSQSGTSATSGEQISMITEGTILYITPQISSNGYVTLDISPALTRIARTVASPTGNSTAPELETKQASALVRVPDGTTIVLGGLIYNETATNKRKVPLLGDIPVLGYLFTGTFDAKSKKELVIFITPRIVP